MCLVNTATILVTSLIVAQNKCVVKYFSFKNDKKMLENHKKGCIKSLSLFQRARFERYFF